MQTPPAEVIRESRVARAWPIVLLVLVSACAHQHPPPADLSPAPGTVTMLHTTAAEIETRPRPAKLELTQVEGASIDHLQTLFNPAAEPIHRCLPGRAPGKVILRVTATDGRLSITPVAGVTLDDAGRSCALEALSSLYMTETGSNVGGVSIPPSGFTSLLTVTW